MTVSVVDDRPDTGPPHDDAAERAVLAAALWDPAAIDQAVDTGLTPAAFYSPAHALLWATTLALHRSGTPVTPITVKTELDARAHLSRGANRALGPDPTDLLAELATLGAVPDGGHTARRLLDLAAARDAISLATRIAQKARTSETPGPAVEQLLREHLDRSSAATPATASWSPVDLTAYLDGTHEPELATITPRTDGQALFYAGRLHSMHGESESGKSLVAQAACAAEIREHRDALYIDWESDAATIVSRLLLMGCTVDDVRAHLTYIRPDAAPHGLIERPAWDALLARSFTIAVLDGVTDALGQAGAATKENDDIARWMAVVPRALAAATGAATILIDHVTKDEDKRGRFALGGGAKMNALDGAAYTVEMTEPIGRGLAGVVTLRIGKDRPGAIRPACGRWRSSDRTQEAARVRVDSTDGPIDVVFDPPRSNVTDGPTDPDAPPTFRPTGVMQKVSLLLERSHQPLSGRQIIDALKADGLKARRQTVLDAIELLIAGENIELSDGPRGARMHTITRIYRERLDPLSDRYDGATDASWSDSASDSRAVPDDRFPPIPSDSQVIPGIGQAERFPPIPDPRTTYGVVGTAQAVTADPVSDSRSAPLPPDPFADQPPLAYDEENQP